MANFIFYLCLCSFIGLSFFLILIILAQESRSLGLGASFGGDSSSSLFGTSTADIIKKITRYLITIFFLLSIFFSFWCGKISEDTFMSSNPSIESVEEGI